MTKNKTTIKVDLDTSKLTLKARAIAKHAEALADELERIDKDECNELSEKQVGLLHKMIDNYCERDMEICSCDIKRVLELRD